MKDIFHLHWLELLVWVQAIKHKREQNISKKDHFSPPLRLTFAEKAKSVQLKYANHLADKTFLFVNIGSVICFPMPIGKNWASSCKNLCFSWWSPYGSLKGECEVKSNQNNFYWIILNKALFLCEFSKWSNWLRYTDIDIYFHFSFLFIFFMKTSRSLINKCVIECFCSLAHFCSELYRSLLKGHL